VSDWHNVVLPMDVDDSRLVTPLDALVVIDDLNARGIRTVPEQRPDQGDVLCDVDGDGWFTPLDALVVINALNSLGSREPALVGGVAPSSDPNNNGVVLNENISIKGQTLPNSSVVVQKDTNGYLPFAETKADSEGRFALNVHLSQGLQTVRLTSRDDLGRSIQKNLEIRFGNVIQDWNAAILDVVRQWSTTSNDPYQGRIVTSQPPMVARNLAMIHTAMFEAANAVNGQYSSYKVNLAPQIGASPDAAAAAAAFEVAKGLYAAEDELAVWQASLNESFAQESETTARDLGIALGKRIGQTILADRANDGSKAISTYLPSSEVGHWQRTAPDYLPPLLSQWPNVKTFAMTNADEFRPAPPPTLDSPEYSAAVDQVMQLGGFQSSLRTAEQTEIALFWADGGGTATPPGHWNQIASDLTMARGTNLVDTSRTLALLNIAMADAGIASWDSKYHYDLWRPIDAIRLADQDGNALTSGDLAWIPLLKTPPFPTYTSGHSTFSGAASTVLASLFGDEVAFDSRNDGHLAPEQRPLDPTQIVTRRFGSFSQAAQEAGMSRIYGGIHFAFDNSAGLDLGREIGLATIARLLTA
jgi:hypothetical protein